VSDVALIAFGAVSALGEGRVAFDAGSEGQPARVAIGTDDELVRAGLARPYAARAHVPVGVEDRATWLLRRALEDCAADLDRVRPSWRGERVGLFVGTSSGGMRQAEQAFEQIAAGQAVADAEGATYHGPLARAVRDTGLSFDPVLLVLGACASSVLAIGLATRCLTRGDCDVVLAGGFDDVTVFVAAGFEVLRATTASPPPRPFRIGRDGMSLGEGAALVALVRDARRAKAMAFVTGFGAASDAVHLTAPDREGRALSRAVDAALAEAGRPRVDLVSPHATATPFNDPVEARILAAALGEPGPVVAPFKAQIGHTLGAAGVLETLHCVDALGRGILPASAGEGDIEPEARVRLLACGEPGSPATALKLACAFGGSNAALVLGKQQGTGRAMRPAFVTPGVLVPGIPGPDDVAALIAAAPVTTERLARVDGLVLMALAVVAALGASGVSLDGAGIVVGSALATLETNALFAARIRERGARMAEPRRFPYTSPNAVAGECSIVFGLTGPGFSVGGGMHAALEALAAATWLVEAGDAERVVVVAVDEVGPATVGLGFAGDDRDGGGVFTGAVAALVSAEPAGALGRIGSIHIRRGAAASAPAARPCGHRALMPLVEGRGPAILESGSPPDALARIVLEPV
jgi:3-oxoacyl-[acyl-carrier-protein] synthase-1/3-oxoacyl-[acyl-carrier-protein] synthase II